MSELSRCGPFVGAFAGDAADLNLIFVLAAQPGSAIRIVLFLPDRDDLLDPLDRVAAGLECGVAMRRGDADDNTRLPDRQRADAVDNGDLVNSPAFPNLVPDLRHGQLGGRGICLVFEMGDRLAAAVVAHGPDERRDRASARVRNQRLREPWIEGFVLNGEPRLTAAA